MRRLRHAQPSLWEGVLADEVSDLWEPWMREVDGILEDDELLTAVFQAQGRRRPESHRRGRSQTPAEVVLRMPMPVPDQVCAWYKERHQTSRRPTHVSIRQEHILQEPIHADSM